MPCFAALCRVASRRAVALALWRVVVRCAVVSRCAVVGQSSSAWPVSWYRVRAGVWLAGGLGVRLGVGVSLGPCCERLGMPLGLVGRVGVRRVPSLGACVLVSCPLGVPIPSPGRCGRAFVLFRCL